MHLDCEGKLESGSAGHRRRGSAYLVILVTAMLATVIGLAGLYAARIQGRTSESISDAATARLLAVSAVDLGTYFAGTDPAWRTLFTHDVWSSPQTLGRGTVRYKFVDEIDGKLSLGLNDPVRVVGRGEIGDSVQMCSVLLGERGDNLLTNPGMESTTDWSAAACTIDPVTGIKHSGSASIWCRNRTIADGGPWQEVSGKVSSGELYYVSAWIRFTGAGHLEYTITVRADADFDVHALVPAGRWVKVEGYVQPQWALPPGSVEWRVRSRGHTEDFHVDDVVLEKVVLGDRPLRGTWRREVDP